MNKIRFIVASSSVVAITCALSLANAQIPDSYKGKFPKPKSKTTRWSYLADMDANIPIVILVNRTGGTLTDYTQLEIYVDDKLGVMSHGKGNLPNGQQRIIAPYIRSGGTVKWFMKSMVGFIQVGTAKGRFKLVCRWCLHFFPKVKLPSTSLMRGLNDQRRNRPTATEQGAAPDRLQPTLVPRSGF